MTAWPLARRIATRIKESKVKNFTADCLLVAMPSRRRDLWFKSKGGAACNDRGMRFSRFSIRIYRQCIRLTRKTWPPRRWSSLRFLEHLSLRRFPSAGIFLVPPIIPDTLSERWKLHMRRVSHRCKRMRFIWILLGCLLIVVRFCYCRRKFTAKELCVYGRFSWSFSKYWM